MWRIYYADNTKFTSEDGSVFDAPARGVQVITQPDKYNGFRTVMGDYYIFQPWGWEGCDINGLFDYLCEPGPKTVKFGRTIANDDYSRIFQRALDEAKP